MSIAPGTRLGRYEIRSVLGAGGMGEVYLAYDPELERDVALKVIRPEAAASGDRVRRFVQEAKAASALHHPNVAHIYEIGSDGEIRFIAMEMIEGETLRDALARGPLPIDRILDLAAQIAAALAAAHKHNIVHRDVKPENVMITSDGYAKVLDFGLAKLRERADDAATLLMTQPGMTVGTPSYMAPEQLAGSDVTAAADVFSLGVVMYEMIAGRRPFPGGSVAEIATAIATTPPPSLRKSRAETPPRLDALVRKSLSKNAADRYPDAGALLEELRGITRDSMPVSATRHAVSRKSLGLVAAVVILAAIAAGGWWWMHVRRMRAAARSISAAEALVAQRRLPEAFALATTAAEVLPADPRLQEVIAGSSTNVTFQSQPSGATISVQRFKGPGERAVLGTTPLTVRLPLADVVITAEKAGYAPLSRALSLAPFFVDGGPVPQRQAPKLSLRLIESAKLPSRMVFVQGGNFRLTGWTRPSERPVQLADFLLDRFEVSNADFQQFISAGGYRKRELWTTPFADGGKTLSFEEAMERFHDSTGLPGPRSWSGGAPPLGRENHPVTDISWYEAAAFAAWKGKSLPTVYEWERAASYPAAVSLGTTMPWGAVGEGVDATERANFAGRGTMPVDSMPFGMSAVGAYNMAGNVSEWCRNRKGAGFAFRGGGWNDPVYAFQRTGGYPAFFSGPTLGFRCVKELASGGDQGGFALEDVTPVPEYRPVDDRAFAELRSRYDYAKTPLNARVVETVETPDWTRQKIVYTVAGKSVPAYLWLPRGLKPPLQVIHFAPAGDVDDGFRPLTTSVELRLGPIIRSGRAVFAVLLEGYVGRPRSEDFEPPDRRTSEYVDMVAQRVTELRRGLDYLETRPDVDRAHIGFMAISAGSSTGTILTAVEPRYRSVMLIGTGIDPRRAIDAPGANTINFAPRVAPPKFMLHGRYDEDTPFEIDAQPLFRLFREPKRLELYDGGHAPPAAIFVPAARKWFDETLGPVTQ